MIEELKIYYQKHKYLIYFILGIVFSVVSILPYIILGEESIVRYHDQLDGELLVFLYQAKYLFSESNIIMEFMNGVDKNIFVPTAPLAVLLYKIFTPFIGFVMQQWIVIIVAYIGMYLCLVKMIKKEEIAFLVAIVFACLPINVVFGFVLGIPMLLYSFYNLLKLPIP